MKNKASVWVRVKNGKGQTTGYLEKFKSSSGIIVSIPSASRWIEGPDFDLSKAQIISE